MVVGDVDMHTRDSILYAKLQRPGRFGPGLLVEYFMDSGCLAACFLSSLVNANMIDIITGPDPNLGASLSCPWVLWH